MLENIHWHNIVTYWDLNPRQRNQDFIDDLFVNMKFDGYNEQYPLTVFRFDGDKGYQLIRWASSL